MNCRVAAAFPFEASVEHHKTLELQADRGVTSRRGMHEAMDRDIERIEAGIHAKPSTAGAHDFRQTAAHPRHNVETRLENLGHGALASQSVGQNVWTESLEKDLRGRYSEVVVSRWLRVAAMFKGQGVTIDIANELEPEGTAKQLKEAIQKRAGIPAACQRLLLRHKLHRDRDLAESTVIWSCGIRDAGAVVHVKLAPESPEFVQALLAMQ